MAVVVVPFPVLLPPWASIGWILLKFAVDRTHWSRPVVGAGVLISGAQMPGGRPARAPRPRRRLQLSPIEFSLRTSAVESLLFIMMLLFDGIVALVVAIGGVQRGEREAPCEGGGAWAGSGLVSVHRFALRTVKMASILIYGPQINMGMLGFARFEKNVRSTGLVSKNNHSFPNDPSSERFGRPTPNEAYPYCPVNVQWRMSHLRGDLEWLLATQWGAGGCWWAGASGCWARCRRAVGSQGPWRWLSCRSQCCYRHGHLLAGFY